MRAQNYKRIFSLMEDTLRKQSVFTSKQFDSNFGKYKKCSYEIMSDNDIFRLMVAVAFYSGMKASVVSERLPVIEGYLNDFRKVKDYTKDDVGKILRDPGTIHHKKKVEACIDNAREFGKIIAEHGSFGNYLESFGQVKGEATINRLREDLTSRFHYLGQRTVNHFLTDLGFNVLKPDRVICRIFSRLGLIDDENRIDQTIKVGRNIAAATGHPIRYVDIVLVKYGQMGEEKEFGLKDGVCLEKNPKCSICGVREYCGYFACALKT